MTFGDILTWVIFAVIVVFFLIGLRHIYHNFCTGESDCCANGNCSACAHCAEERITDEERKGAKAAWEAERREVRKTAQMRKEQERPCGCCHEEPLRTQKKDHSAESPTCCCKK